ncbi:hypothetical protein LEM8419_03537 [Neolewinella maritima]|uniref:Uncharacterized protein n=1 Tax=Neolewinella maritima TaxID=1383882 RepID=A0ABN8FEK9_9BACT|nr:hypothetical protein [Neolewinella maritima]CAH1002665.1 hypothetical protein LEM8419_03537 [Neolewinella maritima]
MVKRTVKQGSHNYRPGYAKRFCRTGKGFTLTLSFDAGSWFDPTVRGPLAKDGKDWNKAGGITTLSIWKPSTWLNNHCAALVVFRPGEVVGTWEIAAYVNDEQGGFEAERLGTFQSGEEVTIDCHFHQGTARYVIAEAAVVLDFDPQPFQLPIGPWFGGNQNSPNTGVLYSIQSTH